MFSKCAATIYAERLSNCCTPPINRMAVKELNRTLITLCGGDSSCMYSQYILLSPSESSTFTYRQALGCHSICLSSV